VGQSGTLCSEEPGHGLVSVFVKLA
jgi:hypothetical protein